MIVFSDLIDLTLILYVWICLYVRGGIEKKTRMVYFRAGIPLIAILLLDQIWQLVYSSYNFQPLLQRHILTALTSVCYMLVPVVYFNFLLMGRKRWKTWKYWLAVALFAFYVILPVFNIRYHFLFYHNKNMDMVITPMNAVLSTAEFIYFAYLLVNYCRINFPVDRQDHILVIFVVVVVSLGQIAQNLQVDISSTWDSLTIAYLLMYLAVKNLSDKTDIVTAVANRSSYLEFLRRPQFGKERLRTVTVFDMNQLKHYNDTQGHKMGDAYLYAFAQTMRTALQGCGHLYRTGGDEFVLLSEMQQEAVTTILEKLQNMPHCDSMYGDFPLDFAYGIVKVEKGERIEEAVVRADHEMYLMKRKMHEVKNKDAKDNR
ncbi:MAG: GGDEF domain-containing protein [Eubacterium sp.]|jgi:diguanylate cyclase (GGDEF)-like protein|nr:GGDEF domain-containing protein [Eubacterium sp.]